MQPTAWIVRAVLVLLVLGGAAAAKPYTGAQCTGVVDFALQDSAPIASIDAAIAFMFGLAPKWLTEACQDAARTAQCGVRYGAVADVGSGMCKSQCEQILQPCAQAAGLNDDLAAVVGVDAVCGALSDVNCVEVGELDESLHATAECPSPLVTTKPHPGAEYEGFVLRVPGTACAIGCPAGDTFFGETKNRAMEALFFALSAFSVFAGLLVLVGLQPKGTRLYAWMFTFCGTVGSLVLLIYNIIGHRETLCDEGIGHRRRAPAMVAVGIVLHYFYLCGILWVCLQAFSTWMIVKTGTRRNKIERWQKYYWGLSLLLPAILCCFPASANNYGWSTQVFIPFPFMVFEDTQDYFWATIYTPMTIILLVQVVLTIDASWSFFKLYKTNRAGGHRNSISGVAGGKKREFFRYNREPLLLMFSVGVFTLLNAVGVGYSLHQARHDVEAGFEDYVKCLLANAVPGAEGECVRSDFYFDLYFVAVIQCFYIVSYPIMALITFGPSAFVWRRVGWLAGMLTSAPDSRELVSDTKHSRGSLDHRRHHSSGKGLQMKTFKGSNDDDASSVYKASMSSPGDIAGTGSGSFYLRDKAASSVANADPTAV